MKGTLHDVVRYLILFQNTDDVEGIFKNTFESPRIKKGDEDGSISSSRGYIEGFRPAFAETRKSFPRLGRHLI
jgi:hypothetical protein